MSYYVILYASRMTLLLAYSAGEARSIAEYLRCADYWQRVFSFHHTFSSLLVTRVRTGHAGPAAADCR